MKITNVLLASFLSLNLASCALESQESHVSYDSHIITGNLITGGYTIADSLIIGLNKTINKKDPIIVSTFSNINDLESSTTFGRMLSEQIASRFAQRGFVVREMKFRQNSIFISKENGEFVLSRDINAISKENNASAVIVGTYGESADGAYVSARIIDPSDSTIISSCDYGLRMGSKKDILFSKR